MTKDQLQEAAALQTSIDTNREGIKTLDIIGSDVGQKPTISLLSFGNEAGEVVTFHFSHDEAHAQLVAVARTIFTQAIESLQAEMAKLGVTVTD